MATNRVQFQPGLSLPAFLKQYGTQAALREGAVASALAGRLRVSGVHRPDVQQVPA